MKDRGNAGVIALILAALVGINYMPRASRETQGTTGQQVETQAEHPTVSSAAGPSQPCKPIGSRLERFFADPKEVPYPAGCHGTGKPSSAQPKLDLVVALLPNPLETHLPLTFDRGIEAIVQAAQDEGYLFDSSWFPWSEEQRNYSHLADDLAYRERKHLMEQQPGVLVFRRNLASPTRREGLVVFVVGEQPTHGVNDEEFTWAIRWVSTLTSKNRKTLRILGPYSSGTLTSLQHKLEDLGQHKELERFDIIKISSGTVSSRRDIERFRASLKRTVPCSLGDTRSAEETDDYSQCSFRTYSESDAVKTERFCQYLKDAGYDLGRVAFLSEDQTAYGGANVDDQELDTCASKGRSDVPIYLYFPRDIGALRAAYEQQSTFSSGKQPTNTPSTTLRGELIEPAGSKFDSPRTYGGQLDLLAMESVLQAMTVQLELHHVQFVVIRSTNPLDRVFLSQFLSRAYPEARIVLDGADLLFLRSGPGMSARGILAISTYPLLPGQQRWTKTLHAKHNGSYRIFGQDTIEGTYLAMRGLMERDSRAPAQVPIYDSLPPWWAPVRDCSPDKNPDCGRPATWITVIGHGRFWPIAALSEATDVKIGSPSMLKRASEDEHKNSDPPQKDDCNAGAHLLFPREMWVLLLLCSLMGGWQLYCCWCGSIRGRFAALTYFAPQPRWEYNLLVFLSCIVIAIFGAVLAVLSGMIHSAELPTFLSVWMWTATVWLWLCAALSLFGNLTLPRLHACGRPAALPAEKDAFCGAQKSRFGRGRKEIVSWVAALALFTVGYGVFLELYLVSNHFSSLTPANLFPTFWRAVNLFSFVSPLLPMIILLFGLRGWIWCNLHGMSLMGYDRPRLPREERIPLMEVDQQAKKSIMRFLGRRDAQIPVELEAMPLGVHWFKVFLACIAGATAAFSLALWGFTVRSLGERHYGNLVFWWLVIVSAMLLTDTIQMARTWKALRVLLVLLDRLRLRRTLAAMRGIAWGSVWKMGGNVIDERYRIISRQIESLMNLSNEVAKPYHGKKVNTSAPSAMPNLKDRIKSCMQSVHDFGEWYVELSESHSSCLSAPMSNIGPVCRFQEELADTAAAALTEVLVPEWRKESDSLLFDKTELKSEAPAGAQTNRPFAPCEGMSDLVRAAEEFFVLPYLGFIQNMIARIRSTAIGMLALFLGLTLAVASYPFEPRQPLGFVFVGLFLISGITVAYVYAGMLRNATLSYVTDTNPGELGWQFWLRLLTFGIGPLIALLTTLFPSLTDFLVSWFQPGSQALK